MKKLKYMLFIISISILLPVMSVNAIDKTILDENIDRIDITMPMLVFANKALTIRVSGTENYTMSYQWMKISEEKSSEINDAAQISEDKTNEINDWIDDNKPLRDDYETTEEYNTAVSDYQSELNEKKEELNSLNDHFYDIIPNFDDTKWLPADGNVINSVSSFDSTYILFIKLVDNDTNDVVYDVQGYRKKKDSTSGATINEDAILETKIKDVDEPLKNNPKTGIEDVLLPATILMVGGAVSLFYIRKKNVFKRI